eukprot:scaffold315022_cov35-Tisochrysis_lutea.AAC.2
MAGARSARPSACNVAPLCNEGSCGAGPTLSPGAPPERETNDGGPIAACSGGALAAGRTAMS